MVHRSYRSKATPNFLWPLNGIGFDEWRTANRLTITSKGRASNA